MLVSYKKPGNRKTKHQKWRNHRDRCPDFKENLPRLAKETRDNSSCR